MISNATKSIFDRFLSLERGVSATNIAILTILALTVWTLSLYAESFASMIRVWKGSNTFTHGFLIIPISAYLVWQKRGELRSTVVKPSAVGIVLLLVAVFLWIMSSLASTQVGEHIALVAIVGASVWSACGTEIARIIRFPLVFAFFAAPFGEFLIPPLMAWTANFTVWALDITGVPVFLEGYYFSLPSGNFEVIEACSGIRYLIVTVVLGIYFAYEKFTTGRMRAMFVGFAAAVIIIANGVRAYLIVLIAHLSDMKYGAGPAHIYFGWFVFVVVITTIFWVGNVVAERVALNSSSVAAKPGMATDSPIVPRISILVSSILVFAIIASGPLLLTQVMSRQSGIWPRPYLPEAMNTWQGPSATQLGFQPTFPGADYVLTGNYVSNTGAVEFHEVFFAEQRQGDELVGPENSIFDSSKWRLVQRIGNASIILPETGRIQAKEILLTNKYEKILVWYWYDIGGWRTTSAISAKIYHALQRLVARTAGDALVIVVTSASDNTIEQDSLRLASFLRDHFSQLNTCLRTSTHLPVDCAADDQQK